MKRVSDPVLEKAIFTIIVQLVGSEEEAAKICFALYDDILAIGFTWIDLDEKRHLKKHLINLNLKVKEMLKSKEERPIVVATLAHEIGHVLYFREPVKEPFEFNLVFQLMAEVEADKIALVILKNIYQNPKEILIRQIDSALRRQLERGTASDQENDLAIKMHQARKGALEAGF